MLTAMTNSQDSCRLAEVISALTTAQSILIISHLRPDADTIGSGLALGQALVALGKTVSVTWAGEDPLAPSLASLAGAELLVAAAASNSPAEVLVAVDCASEGRLGQLAERFVAEKTTINIDHHASNSFFATLNFVDAQANCTTELILQIIDALGLPLTEKLAEPLYAGLVTDTGSFRWGSAYAHVMAGRLLETGIDAAGLSRKLLDSHPVGWLALVSDTLASARVVSTAFGGLGLVYAVAKADVAEDLSWSDSESLIDLVRTVDGVEVAVVFKEIADDSWSVSLRAKGAVDVSALAQKFGGGGHINAAGYSAPVEIDRAITQLLAEV